MRILEPSFEVGLFLVHFNQETLRYKSILVLASGSDQNDS